MSDSSPCEVTGYSTKRSVQIRSGQSYVKTFIKSQKKMAAFSPGDSTASKCLLTLQSVTH